MGLFSLIFFVMAILLAQSHPEIHSCEDVTQTGIYTLKYKTWAVDVICDAETDGGGWLVILKREGGHQNFFTSWKQYRDRGVGRPETEYILPLQFLHEYLSEYAYELLQEVSEGDQQAWAFFSMVVLGSEKSLFPLQVGHCDTASTKHCEQWVGAQKKFYTFDTEKFNDFSFGARKYHSAIWFDQIRNWMNPLGNYENNTPMMGINGGKWKGNSVSLDTYSGKLDAQCAIQVSDLDVQDAKRAIICPKISHSKE